MSMDAIFQVSRFGLDYERLRLQAATRNIAMSDVAVQPGKSANLQSVAMATDFARAVDGSGSPGMSLVEQRAPLRQVHDPKNPMADAHGMVSYPRIDMARQMGVLISASRSYEANVRAFNALHDMVLAALNIGVR